jgi:hypothetical protein
MIVVNANVTIERSVVEVPRRDVLRVRHVLEETGTGPTPFLYEYRFAGDDSTATLQLRAQADPGSIASLLGPLAEHGLSPTLATADSPRLRGRGRPVHAV